MPDGSVARCYAEAIAEGVAQNAYPHGFAHHYWRPSALDEPLKLKAGARIFLDSMSDLMGSWVPAEQIKAVLDVCRRASRHTFQLLTKNAPRLKEFTFPDNVWVGVSAPPSTMFGQPLAEHRQRAWLRVALRALDTVNVPVRWMSIEPLSFDIAPQLADSNLQWAVIGAASSGTKIYQPRPEWVNNVLRLLDSRNVPVFFKGNLAGNSASTPWRAEFPVMDAQAHAVTQMSMWDDDV
jgi:protein gp37